MRKKLLTTAAALVLVVVLCWSAWSAITLVKSTWSSGNLVFTDTDNTPIFVVSPDGVDIEEDMSITFLDRDMCVATGVESITGNASIATGLGTMNSASAIAETVGATAGYPFICSYSISSGTLTVYLWQDDGTAATVGSDVAWIAVGK